MPDAGQVTVTSRGKPVAFRVAYTVREYDPASRDGRERLGRIERILRQQRLTRSSP